MSPISTTFLTLMVASTTFPTLSRAAPWGSSWGWGSWGGSSSPSNSASYPTPSSTISATTSTLPISTTTSTSTTPILPTYAATLPQPTTSLVLIALGLGIQNYTCTCNTTTSTLQPTSIGALATLYDATSLLTTTNTYAGAFANVVASQLTHVADATDTGLGLQQVGTHFFDSAGTPNFDLPGKGAYLYARKVGDIPAPAGSAMGRDGGAAVGWLYLSNDGSGRSFGGVGGVYRVETSGGGATAEHCARVAGGGVVSKDYAAEYWFCA